jgi:hypothetical protein
VAFCSTERKEVLGSVVYNNEQRGHTSIMINLEYNSSGCHRYCCSRSQGITIACRGVIEMAVWQSRAGCV